MSLVCSGWWADRTKTARVHDEVRVLRDDGDNDQPSSHGICADCKDAFLDSLPMQAAEAAKEGTE
mgnify:CR=1 FL=1